MNSASGLVTISGIKKSIYLDALGEMLGFRGDISPTKDPPLDLAFLARKVLEGTGDLTKDSKMVSLDPNKEYPSPINITATELPSLMRYKEIFVHLHQGLSTLENRHNGFPSTPLSTIAVGTENCNTGVKADVTLVKRQCKPLDHGILSGLHVSVRDADGQLLSCISERCIRSKQDVNADTP